MDTRAGQVRRGVAWVALVAAVLFLLFALWRSGAERAGGPGPSAAAGAEPGAALQRRAVEGERASRTVEERNSTAAVSSEEERAPSTMEPTRSGDGPGTEATGASQGAASSRSSAPFLVKISAHEGGLSARLREGDRFGAALTEIADLDGDGLRELAVGAPGDDEAGEDAGAVWILFLGRDGRVREQRAITPLGARLPARSTPGTAFGQSLCFLETRELAVARTLVPEAKGEPAAEVWLLELGRDAQVVAKRSLHADDLFGETVPPEVSTLVVAAPSGPFAGDRNWLAVGIPAWPENFPQRVTEPDSGWITHFRLGSDGRIAATGGLPPMSRARGTVNDYGRAILLADVYGDGLQLENVAGYRLQPESVAGYRRGERGEVLRHSASRSNWSDRTGSLTFRAGEDPEDPGFGSSLAWLGDRDGDGSLELAIGLAEKRPAQGASPGGIWIVSIDRKDLGVVRSLPFLPGERGTAGRARPGDRFGASLATLADRDGDARADLGIGAPGDDDGESDAGAVWLLGIGAIGTSGR